MRWYFYPEDESPNYKPKMIKKKNPSPQTKILMPALPQPGKIRFSCMVDSETETNRTSCAKYLCRSLTSVEMCCKQGIPWLYFFVSNDLTCFVNAQHIVPNCLHFTQMFLACSIPASRFQFPINLFTGDPVQKPL